MTEARPIPMMLADRSAKRESRLLAGAGRDLDGVDVRSSEEHNVTSMGGMTLTRLGRFAAWGRSVVMPGGREAGRPEPVRRVVAPLRQARPEDPPVATIGPGIHALTGAGLPDGRRHTGDGREWINHVSPDHAGRDLHEHQPQALRHGAIIAAAGTVPTSFAAAVPGPASDRQAGFRAMPAAARGAQPAA